MSKTIVIFEPVEMTAMGNGRPTFARGGDSSTITRAVERSIDEMQEHMTGFIEAVQAMLTNGAKVAGEFQMNKVEVQAQIGLEGKIGFLGSGASASGSSQITIVFERKQNG
jgi:hypothetical protein